MSITTKAQDCKYNNLPVSYILLMKNLNYQYIMEDIIIRIEQINTIVNVLENNDQTKFNKISKPFIKQINDTLTDLENIIKIYRLSEEKLVQMDLENSRYSVIMKKLFPFYWMFYEKYGKMPIEELNQIDNNSHQ